MLKPNTLITSNKNSPTLEKLKIEKKMDKDKSRYALLSIGFQN